MPHLAAKMLENAENARKCWNGRKVKFNAGKIFPDAVKIILRKRKELK